MEDKDTLLFEVLFDAKDTDKKAAQTRVNMERLRDAKRELTKEFRAKDIGADEFGQGLQAIEKQLTGSQKELRGYTKALADNDRVQKASKGSINQMRASLSTMVGAYDNLSEAERNNEKVGGRLEAQIKGLNAELLSLESATGRNQRNVGNYSGAIEPLIQQLVKLQEQQKAVGQGSVEYENMSRRIIGFQQQINQTGATSGKSFDEVQDKVQQYGEAIRETTKELVQLEQEQEQLAEQGGEAFEKIGFKVEAARKKIEEIPSSTKGSIGALAELDNATGLFGGRLGQMGDFLGRAKAGLEGFKTGLGGIRAAIAATGIGLLILALGGLIAAFKSTDEGAELLERKIGGLKAGFTELMEGIAPLGKRLYDAFFNRDEFLKKLKQGTDEYSVSLGKLTDDIKRVSAAQEAYIGVMQEVEDVENELIGQRARVSLQVDLALKKQKDRSLTAKQQIAILDDAGRAEENLAKKTEANAKRAYDEAVRLNKEQGKNRKLKDEEVLALQQAEEKYVNTQRETLTAQQAIQNRRSAAIEKQIAEQKEAADKAIEAERYRLTQLVAAAKIEEQLAKARGQDTLGAQEKIIRAEGKLQAQGLKKNSEERKLVEVETNAKILELRLNHAYQLYEQTSATERATIAAQATQAIEGSRKLEGLRIRELQRQETDERKRLKLEYDTKKIDKVRYDAEIEDLTQRTILEQNRISKEFDAERINREAELAKIVIQAELDVSEEYLAIRRNQATAVINLEEKQALALLALQVLSKAEYDKREAGIQNDAIKRRKAVYREIDADRRADKRAELETQLADTIDGSRKELRLQKGILALQMADELANTEDGEKQKDAIRAKYRKQERELTKTHNRALFDFITESISQATQALGKLQDAQVAAQLRRIDQQQEAAVKSAGLSAEARERIEIRFQKQREKLEREAAIKRKRIATVENIIGVARGIVEAQKLPFPLNLLQSALVIATGAAQQAVIASQTFARGGVLDGPSHAQGGIKYRIGTRLVELEGGEGVINKKSMAMPGVREKASALNELGGGVRFPGVKAQKIYPVRTKMELGGYIATQEAKQLNRGVELDYDKLGRVVAGMVVKAAAAIPPPVVSLDEFAGAQGKRVRIVNDADIKIG